MCARKQNKTDYMDHVRHVGYVYNVGRRKIEIHIATYY